jgi:hypothetical protein
MAIATLPPTQSAKIPRTRCLGPELTTKAPIWSAPAVRAMDANSTAPSRSILIDTLEPTDALLGLGETRFVVVGGLLTCVLGVATTLPKYEGGTCKRYDHRS